MRNPRKKQLHDVMARLKTLVAAMEADPLRPLDIRILEFIAERKGASQVEIAQQLRTLSVSLAMSTISRLISRLAMRGYVKRLPGKDNRTNCIAVTGKGRTALHAFDERINTAFAALKLEREVPVGLPPLILRCPSCSSQLRITKYGHGVRNSCPKCRQGFVVRFEEGSCVLDLGDVAVREGAAAIDPHTVLGIHRNATDTEIDEAWRGKLKILHPDRFHHLGDDFVKLATRHSQAINHARDVLLRKR